MSHETMTIRRCANVQRVSFNMTERSSRGRAPVASQDSLVLSVYVQPVGCVTFRSLEGEQHLSMAVAPSGVADRIAVVRKCVRRLDRLSEGAVPHQVGEHVV